MDELHSFRSGLVCMGLCLVYDGMAIVYVYTNKIIIIFDFVNVRNCLVNDQSSEESSGEAENNTRTHTRKYTYTQTHNTHTFRTTQIKSSTSYS